MSLHSSAIGKSHRPSAFSALVPSAPSALGPATNSIEAFRSSFPPLGYTEGENIRIYYRYADGSIERFSAASLSYRSATSYQPVIDLLKTYFRFAESDEIAEKRNKVADRLLGLDETLAPDLQAFLVLLDIAVEERSWQELNAFQRRERMLAALKRLILREAQQQPVILVFEDLHWIDGETQAFLKTLIGGLASAPVLLILTCRPEYAHHWGSKTYYSQLRLDALPPEAADAFLGSLLGSDTSLVFLKRSLQGQGNPFVLEESIRSLVETGLLEGARGDYRLVRSMPELLLPPTVHALLAARIDRLPGRSKRLLQAAAVIGKDIPRTILRLIADLEEDDFRCALDNLQDAEFVYEARLFPDLDYTFKHGLTHEVAYGSLLAEQRRTFHRRIVDAIEQLYPDRLGEHVEQLAHHAVRSDLREKAVPYLWRSGLKAFGRSAPQDAKTWFEQALGVLASLPESPSTLEQAFDIRLELRMVLIQLGDVGRALERAREAETLAEKLNDDRRRGRVCSEMTNVHSMSGEVDDALSSATRALEIAERLGDFRLRVQVTNRLGQAHYFRNDYEQVVRIAAGNLTALPADWVDEESGLATPPSVYDRCWLIMGLAELGRFVEAAKPTAELIRLAALTQHAFTVGFAHWAAGEVHLLRGDWVRARALIEGATVVLRAGNVGLLLPASVAALAWVQAQLGEASGSLDRLREGEQLLERQTTDGYVGLLGSSYRLLARTALVLRRLDDAQRLGDRAVESSPRQPGFAAHALDLLGDISIDPDRFDAKRAEAYYAQALALAEPRGMRPLIAHCHLGLAKLYRRTGKRQEAQEHLTMAIQRRAHGSRTESQRTANPTAPAATAPTGSATSLPGAGPRATCKATSVQAQSSL